MASFFRFLGNILRWFLGKPQVGPDPVPNPAPRPGPQPGPSPADPAAPPLSQPTPPRGPDNPPLPSIPDELLNIDVPGLPPIRPGRQWTFMIFMAGDNGLKFETEAGWERVMAEMTSAGYKDIVELRTAGTSDQVACVVQFDTVSENDRSYRIIINPPGQAPTVQNIPETNTGDPATLRDFIIWGQQTFPAQHYAVVIWNHGGGWKEDDLWERYRDALPVGTRDAGSRDLVSGTRLRKSLFLRTTDRIMALPDTAPAANTRSAAAGSRGPTPTRGIDSLGDARTRDLGPERDWVGDWGEDLAERADVRSTEAFDVPGSDVPLLDRILAEGLAQGPDDDEAIPSTRWIAADDSSKDFLDNAELQAAFQQAAVATGETVDIIGMDACLMAMAEVAFQLRHNAAFLVASQEVEPMAGWDYTNLLRTLVMHPGLRPEQVAQAMVDLYMASYAQDERRAITQSATILAQMDTLADLLNRFVIAVDRVWPHHSQVRTALRRAQLNALTFDDPDYRDLVDFLRLVAWEMASLPSQAVPNTDTAATNDGSVVDGPESIRRAAEVVLQMVKDPKRTPVLAHGVSGVQYQQSGTGEYRAHGLAIYLPDQHISQFYDDLDFRASRWGKLIRLLNGVEE